MTSATPLYDLDQIHRTIKLLLETGQVYEFRAFARGTVSGCFPDIDKLAQAASRLSERAPTVYMTINPVLADLLARSANRLTEFARTATNDQQIFPRRWLTIDFVELPPLSQLFAAELAEEVVALLDGRS